MSEKRRKARPSPSTVPIPEGKRRLLFIYSDGRSTRATVPQKARVTHGPFSPAGSKHGGDYERAVRIYLGTQQIACVPDVQEFMDEALVSIEEVPDEDFTAFTKAVRES